MRGTTPLLGLALALAFATGLALSYLRAGAVCAVVPEEPDVGQAPGTTVTSVRLAAQGAARFPDLQYTPCPCTDHKMCGPAASQQSACTNFVVFTFAHPCAIVPDFLDRASAKFGLDHMAVAVLPQSDAHLLPEAGSSFKPSAAEVMRNAWIVTDSNSINVK